MTAHKVLSATAAAAAAATVRETKAEKKPELSRDDYIKAGFTLYANGLLLLEQKKWRSAVDLFHKALWNYGMAFNKSRKEAPEDTKLRADIQRKMAKCYYSKAQAILENGDPKYYKFAAILFREASKHYDKAKSTLMYHMKTGYLTQSVKSKLARVQIKFIEAIVVQDTKKLNELALKQTEAFNRLLAKEENPEAVTQMLSVEAREKLNQDFGTEMTTVGQSKKQAESSNRLAATEESSEVEAEQNEVGTEMAAWRDSDETFMLFMKR